MERPNILWVCTDQQRYDTIASRGNPHIRTPNLDRLVDSGLAFTHAYCQSPICTPSRASFLTAMYPSSVHGCMNGNAHWADAAPLVTKLLAASGYDCGLVDKLHLAGAHGRVEPRGEDGYRVFEWSHDPRDQWPEGHAYKAWLAEKGVDLGTLRERPSEMPPELHQTSSCADVAIDFMKADWPMPWLMSVNVFDPHSPFDPPQPFLDGYDPADVPHPLFRESDLVTQRYLEGIDFQTSGQTPEEMGVSEKIAAYYAMVELIDHNVGRMLEALTESGQAENTIVIFMSDHGEMLGDHGLILKGCRFYEGLTRVPLIISWPARFGCARSDRLVELTDVAPFLLEVAGVACPERVQGKSLMRLLEDPEAAHRETVRCEYFHSLNPGGRNDFVGSYGTMIRDERYKLCVYHGHQAGELYDLEEDPGEFENRYEDPTLGQVRFDLMKRSFDALALSTDVGPEQVSPF